MGTSTAARAKQQAVSPLARLVERRLAELDINPFEAARRGGLDKGFVNDILTGRKRTVLGANVAKLAKAIEVTPELITNPEAAETANRDAEVKSHNLSVAAKHPGALIDEAMLIPEIDIRAGMSYGGGTGIEVHSRTPSGDIVSSDETRGDWLLPDYVLSAAGMRAARTHIFEVDGPSMIPDLNPSDRVFVDLGDTNPGRDGIFAVWDGDTQSVVIKNIQAVRGTDPMRIRCTSSNEHYEPFEIILDGSSRIIGRLKYKLARI